MNSLYFKNIEGTIQYISNKIPDPPINLSYISNSATINSVAISFTEPTNVAAISYTTNFGSGNGTSSYYTVSGLTSNTLYNLTLVSIGVFRQSVPSQAFSILTIPNATLIGTATVSGTTASVPFTAPSGLGTITGYTVTSSPGNITSTGTTSPISVSGLTAGTSYTFTINATNLSGKSVESAASNSITAVAESNNVIAIASVTNWNSAGDLNGKSTGSTGTNYNVYSFNKTNTTYTVNYTCNASVSVKLFCIGGGGQGGQYTGGGGGAGGVIQTTVTLPQGTGTISIIVGAGSGTQAGTIQPALSGYNTTVTFNAIGATYIAYGGGGGATGRAATTSAIAGGSGGGDSIRSTGSASSYPCTTGVQSSQAAAAGNIGNSGAGYYFPGKNQYIVCGGGGGAGGPAPTISYSTPSPGGPGMLCTLDGITQFTPNGVAYGTYYWAGGGGGCSGIAGTGGGPGGIGGGGFGSIGNSTRTVGGTDALNNSPVPLTTGGASGGVNTGGGGGGYYSSGGIGGSGGSGIVLIAFP